MVFKYLKDNEKAILRRMERTVVRAMCGQKVIDRRTTEEQMDRFGVEGNCRSVSNSK